MENNIYRLAHNLEGHTVGEWYVEKKYAHKSSTGGNFSVGYEVKHITTGAKGFLKALDYSSAFDNPSKTADILKAMTTAYIFERDLLNKCKNKHLRYIVQIIDSGAYTLPEDQYPPGIAVYPSVDYIVLEKADRSMRNVIDISKAFDYSWILRSLHNVAVAIEEMHSIQIAHQDIKPSNVLIFENKNTSKLGDVGRSSSLNNPADHDAFEWAGDAAYSPFEQLYGYVDPDWKIRRYSCDMFMFGNLIMTCFNNISITSAVINSLPLACRPQNWDDTYENILPQIEKNFAECVNSFNTNIDDDLRQELIKIIKQLCCPNIQNRGDLKNSNKSSQYSLIRFISKLDWLARKYELQVKKVIL